MINTIITTKSAEQTAAFAEKFTKDFSGNPSGDRATTLCLYGELGAGKTTFSQGFAKGLGIRERLLSPTFIIVRRYDLPRQLGNYFYHIDLYRLQTEDDLKELGFDEMFGESGSFVIIEWAEKLAENLPQNRIDIWFSIDEKGRHQITVKENKI